VVYRDWRGGSATGTAGNGCFLLKTQMRKQGLLSQAIKLFRVVIIPS
jgi:hypothetical protein